MEVEEHVYPVLKKINSQSPLVDEMVCHQYNELYMENYCFKVTPADQGVMINNEIGCIQNIIIILLFAQGHAHNFSYMIYFSVD